MPDVDPDLLGQLNSAMGSASPAPDGDSDVDPVLLKQLNAAMGAHASTPVAKRGASPSPVAPHAQTQFQRSVVPETVEPTWGQVGEQALHNAVPSSIGAAQSIGHAIMHPIQTAESIGQIGKGAASQIEGAFGATQDPTTKAKTEALVSALENHYKTAYGSVKGFKQAVGTDPVSVAMDASTLLGGAGAMADAAGLAKTASVISKVGAATDPVQMALKIAKAPIIGFGAAGKRIPGIASAIPVAQSLSTGKSIDALTKAAQVEASGNPALKQAFESHLNRTANPTEIVDTAQSALNQLSKQRGEAYVQKKAQITGGNLPPISWTPVDSALADARAGVRITDPASGVSSVINEGADKALDEIQKKIDFYQAQPANSVFGNLTGFDALKRSIGDIRNTYKNDPVAYQKATQMYNAALDSIKAQHPDYSDLMKQYGDASDQLNQLKGTFGLKNGANDELVLRRLLNTKTSGNKQNLLAQLSEVEPTLPYMLAGHELSPILPGGLRQALNFAAAPVSFGVNPLLTAAQAAAASPRLMGSLNNLAGKSANLAGKLTTKPLTTAAYYASRAGEQDGAPVPSAPTASSDMDTAKAAVSKVESDGSGGYDAIGPVVHHNGMNDRAIGKYQVMSSNIPTWTQQVLGKSMTPQEFLKDHDAQEKVFEGVFGGYLQKYGNIRDALSAWHSGVPLARAVAENRHDQNMSTSKYVSQAGFARGGATRMSHDQLVVRLMNLAKKACKTENEKTEPLLKVPDEAVARALEVAQRTI